MVRLPKGLVVDCFIQATDQLLHIGADMLDIGLHVPCTAHVHLAVSELLVLGADCPLSAGLTLVDMDNSLILVAVRVFAIPMATNVSLANVQVIFLNFCRTKTGSWRWGRLRMGRWRWWWLWTGFSSKSFIWSWIGI